MFSCAIGDFHVAVYSDAQFAAQGIDLFRLQRPEVRSWRVVRRAPPWAVRHGKARPGLRLAAVAGMIAPRGFVWRRFKEMTERHLRPFGSKFCTQYQTEARFFLDAAHPSGQRRLVVRYEEGGYDDRPEFATAVPSDWSDRDVWELIDWPSTGLHYPSWEVPARAFGSPELFRWWRGEIPDRT
jgi:hypothetical protein